MLEASPQMMSKGGVFSEQSSRNDEAEAAVGNNQQNQQAAGSEEDCNAMDLGERVDKRERAEVQDKPTGEVDSESSKEEPDAKRRKFHDEMNPAEKKLNNENWEAMYMRLAAFKVRV